MLSSKGKEIIEYYLRQLEEEGITFVPRWTPPSLGPSSEPVSASKTQAASSAVVPPDTGLKEGLSSEALSSPAAVSEPMAGTPDGGSESFFVLQQDTGPLGSSPPPIACLCFLGTVDAIWTKGHLLFLSRFLVFSLYNIHIYFLLDFFV